MGTDLHHRNPYTWKKNGLHTETGPRPASMNIKAANSLLVDRQTTQSIHLLMSVGSHVSCRVYVMLTHSNIRRRKWYRVSNELPQKRAGKWSCATAGSQNPNDDKSPSVQVMAWCRQATSHYRNQCWPCSMMPYLNKAIQEHKCVVVIMSNSLKSNGKSKMA